MSQVIQRGEQVSRAGGSPVFQVDLDFTGSLPYERTEFARQHVARLFKVPELARTPLLPRNDYALFLAFLRDNDLADHPNIKPFMSLTKDEAKGHGSLYLEFLKGFWHPKLLLKDELAPGLAPLVSFWEQELNGRVVFNTARNPGLRMPSVHVLREGGISDPIVLMERVRGLTSAEQKEARQPMIDRTFGQTVAAADDLPRNLDAMLGQRENTVRLEFVPDGFWAPPPDPASHQINTFVVPRR